jgi:phenylalanyl-tRNA synthetase alpha chain
MLNPTLLSGKQKLFLQLLRGCQNIPSLRQFCQQEAIDFNFLKGFITSGLVDDYLRVIRHPVVPEVWQLTPKGESLQGQLPGAALVPSLLQGQTQVADLQEQLGDAFSSHYGALRKAQLVDWEPGEQGKNIQLLDRSGLVAVQERQRVLTAIVQGQTLSSFSPELSPEQWKTLTEALGEQGWITAVAPEDYGIRALPALDTLDLKAIVTTLTSDLLLSGRWREVELKPYNIEDEADPIAYGRPTLLTQCIERVRDIFLNMGFDEMSGSILESAFWNFDVLFTPQDHPAREMQDTFYVATPAHLPLPNDRPFIQQVQQVHDRCYGGTWSETEASRSIFRAQTTTFTARKLYELQGQTGKFFSIDKVFRNETIDRTHLHEFYQIEGVVVGELLSVRSLMGYLTYFYQRLGFKDLKFKPTYNPYTEPSLEVYAYHEPSGKYLEVGNSGLFRPEMLEPLGCGGRSTIAWGLGLERIALLLYGVDKLGDLVGPDMGLVL